MQFQKCWAGPENNAIIREIHTTSLYSSDITLLAPNPNQSVSDHLIDYQRIPVISFTDHFKASFSIILLYADNALTPKMILQTSIYYNFFSYRLQFSLYLGGLGAPTLPCCPVHVGWPHLLAPPTICWQRRLDVLSALTALSATFLASPSTRTKSGLALLMIVSCCIALCTPARQKKLFYAPFWLCKEKIIH